MDSKMTAQFEKPKALPEPGYKMQLSWPNIIYFTILHLMAIIGLLMEKQTSTVLFSLAYGYFSGIGISGGAHRLYAHRSFKANKAVKIFLIFLQTIIIQKSVFTWARDHRLHHKYSDTNADPHNPKRGFFYSHIGWLMVKRHPDVKKFGERIDVSDLKADNLIMFQYKYLVILNILAGFVLPTAILQIVFGESFLPALMFQMYRVVHMYHVTFALGSVAHMFGMRPHDQTLSATNFKVTSIIFPGEGFHNFHVSREEQENCKRLLKAELEKCPNMGNSKQKCPHLGNLAPVLNFRGKNRFFLF